MTLLNFNHIFSTPTSNTAITWLQDTCVCVCVCWSVCIRRGWSARQTTGSSGSHSGWKKVVSGYQRTQPCLDGSLPPQRGELLPYGEGPNYPPPTAESTFDYILPKAALKGSMQIPLLCLFFLIIKNGCYLLMISLISFFNAAPDKLCSKMSAISAGLCLWVCLFWLAYTDLHIIIDIQKSLIILRCTLISPLKLSWVDVSDSSWMSFDGTVMSFLEQCVYFAQIKNRNPQSEFCSFID